MTGLVFPETGEDLTAAFDNALKAGAMQRDDPVKVTFWARHEYLAFDAEDGMDVFFNSLSHVYVRVPRTEVSE